MRSLFKRRYSVTTKRWFMSRITADRKKDKTHRRFPSCIRFGSRRKDYSTRRGILCSAYGCTHYVFEEGIPWGISWWWSLCRKRTTSAIRDRRTGGARTIPRHHILRTLFLISGGNYVALVCTICSVWSTTSERILHYCFTLVKKRVPYFGGQRHDEE